MTTSPPRRPVVRRVARAGGHLVVADYPGAEPTVIVMHGFPDRRTINEPLAHELDGRRVLLFDFLGYGESSKPPGHRYDSRSFEDDLDAVVTTLTDGPVVLVGHDASGPTAVNWTRRNPGRVERLVLLNCYYHRTPELRFPELIALFADQDAHRLTTTLAADVGFLPFAYFWQGNAFVTTEQARRAAVATESSSAGNVPHWLAGFPFRALVRFVGVSPRRLLLGVRLLGVMARWRFVPTAEQIGWVQQFTDRPSTTEAFLGWTSDLHQDVAANTAGIESLRSITCPVTVAFGRFDPYLTPAVAEAITELFPTGNLHLLDAGHWVQIDAPHELADLVTAAIR